MIWRAHAKPRPEITLSCGDAASQKGDVSVPMGHLLCC